MCGICGVINLNNEPVQKSHILNMMNLMKHRGPDDDGVYLENNIGLGFVRLSIIDLSSSGSQPMIDKTGQHILIFNGEIYNYIELRRKLKSLGYQFNSQSDTEVLLYGLIEWGEKVLDKINGMWAFCYFNKMTSEILISRDRFGIKPLYYFQDNNRLVFSSEIKPLLFINPSLKKLNEKVLFRYLLFNRTNYSDETFFEGIRRLKSSHNLRINLEKKIINISKWYSLREKIREGYLLPDEFRQDIIKSLELQLRSDVPVGLSLSGGLDSSSLFSLISKYFPSSIKKCYSAVYGKNLFGDESYYINLLKPPNIHFVNPNAESLRDDLENFIIKLEEPLPNTSEYAEYQVMKEANKDVKVILSGQGVDEYLGGYLYFFASDLYFFLKKSNYLKLFEQVINYYKNHKDFYPLLYLIYFLIPKNTIKIFDTDKSYYNKYYVNMYYDELYESNLSLFKATNLKEVFLRHFEDKFEHHLIWADKSGMAFSIEARFPFLDHNIVEKSINTLKSLILDKGINKILLRKAMKNYLPSEIVNRHDKMGFETPQQIWLISNTFQPLIKDFLYSSSLVSRDYLNIDKLRKDFMTIVNNEKSSSIIWKFINLEIWMRNLIRS